MTKFIDPWGSGLLEDYAKLIKDFGLEPYTAGMFPQPNRIMRRGVVFAGRDLKRIADAIKHRKEFYILTGIMPSAEKAHLGTKLVIENVRYFQEQGGTACICIADLEALATRGIPLKEGRRIALDFHIPAYISLGLDPARTQFYFQSENKKILQMAYEFAGKVTLNEFRAIYGVADPSRIMSAIFQAGDILYPQFERPLPGIVPVGIDQDPHIRLTRDIVARLKSRYRFIPPSGIYHKYTPSLDGDMKMSKSKPESMIELPEDPASVCRKIKKALTGGRDTVEEHRKLGAVIEKDMVFELLKMHLVEDDAELQRIHDEYRAGRMTSGEIKQLACEKAEKFMADFNRKLEQVRKLVPTLNFAAFQ